VKKLSEGEVGEQLAALKTWRLNSKGQIERQWEFKDFRESVFFVNAVAALAEKLNHHPDILILWNKVTLSVSTHDAGGLTSKDFELARLTDGIL
jgi:4a-hydroxytetrahydrobiopterin dehydratase